MHEILELTFFNRSRLNGWSSWLFAQHVWNIKGSAQGFAWCLVAVFVSQGKAYEKCIAHNSESDGRRNTEKKTRV